MKRYLVGIVTSIIFVSLGCNHIKESNIRLSPDETFKTYISCVAKGKVLEAYEMVWSVNKKETSIVDYWEDEKYDATLYKSNYKIKYSRIYKIDNRKQADVYVIFNPIDRAPFEMNFDLVQEKGTWKVAFFGD